MIEQNTCANIHLWTVAYKQG